MKKKNLIPLLLTAAAIVFEILPYGAKLTFALDGGETKEELFSYFSLTPYGQSEVIRTPYGFERHISATAVLKILEITSYFVRIFALL